jgi:DNA-binding XRE family transcriptional regulator
LPYIAICKILRYNATSINGRAEDAHMVVQYWWERYGNYSPGRANLPHTGEVIACYRAKRYTSQQEFAIAAGVDKQTVAYWENQMYLSDPERRIFLARMLKISPALLGLTWQQVVYQEGKTASTSSLSHFADLAEEDTYYHYEDTVIMGWECFFSGRLFRVADRIGRRLRRLIAIVDRVPECDKEAWLSLLCQFYHLSTQVARHQGASKLYREQALVYNSSALEVATLLVNDYNDCEPLAMSLIRRADIHREQDSPTLAREAAQGAMKYIDQVRLPLKGNMYLIAAEAHAPYTVNDETLEKQVRRWQDKALSMVYDRKVEQDNTFWKLNLAGVHHERAKLFLQLHQYHPNRGFLKDARNELNLAWASMTPDLAEWRVYFHLTDARIFQQEHDLQASAKAGVTALKAAKAMQSKKRESQIQALYYDLMKIDAKNPYVHHLGAELGIFQ